jgi:hypothetical protein
MKRTIATLAATVLFSLGASASDYTYKCQQRTDRSPVNPSVGKVSVEVTQLGQIGYATEYRGDYVDSIDQVKVVVKTTKKGKTEIVKSVTAISTSEDVSFNIDDHGIKFYLYLDELEEAGITLRLHGKKVDVSLACE